MRSERVQPDHLLAVAVGAAIGFFLGLGFAAVAFGCRGSVRRRVVAVALGFFLAVVGGAAGCVGGFQIAWELTRDVAWAGGGAAVGAFALALAAGGAPIMRLLRIR